MNFSADRQENSHYTFIFLHTWMGVLISLKLSHKTEKPIMRKLARDSNCSQITPCAWQRFFSVSSAHLFKCHPIEIRIPSVDRFRNISRCAVVTGELDIITMGRCQQLLSPPSFWLFPRRIAGTGKRQILILPTCSVDNWTTVVGFAGRPSKQK